MKNIYLVGPPATGKSTIGRRLAKKLHRPFYDSDVVIVERSGVSIAWIFDIEGEDKFRERESETIDELTQLEGIVLATGGGAILHEDTRRFLHERGIVIYLQVSVEQQLVRTRFDKVRPLLRTDKPREVLEEMARKRNDLYASIAHYTVSTDQHTIMQVSANITNWLKENEFANK